MDKQINHDKFHDESKTRTHRMSKLPNDEDSWAPNNLLTPEQTIKNRKNLDASDAADDFPKLSEADVRTLTLGVYQINPYLTNGFSHHYHLGESTFVSRSVRSDF